MGRLEPCDLAYAIIVVVVIIIIIIIIIIFLHGLGRLNCSGIDALPSLPGASTISSSSRFVVEGVFRKSGVVHSFEMVDPVLFVFGCLCYLISISSSNSDMTNMSPNSVTDQAAKEVLLSFVDQLFVEYIT